MLKTFANVFVMIIFFLFLEHILTKNIFRTNSLDAHYFGEVKQHLISITLLEQNCKMSNLLRGAKPSNQILTEEKCNINIARIANAVTITLYSRVTM